MTTLREKALGFIPKQTKNIADLPEVSTQIEIFDDGERRNEDTLYSDTVTMKTETDILRKVWDIHGKILSPDGKVTDTLITAIRETRRETAEEIKKMIEAGQSIQGSAFINGNIIKEMLQEKYITHSQETESAIRSHQISDSRPDTLRGCGKITEEGNECGVEYYDEDNPEVKYEIDYCPSCREKKQ